MADTVYGVTATGFKRKRLVDIQGEINSELQTKIGKFLNLLPSSFLGVITGIFAEREDALWQVAEDVYNSQFVGSSSGVALQNNLALIGVTYLPAAKSVQQGLLLFGTPGAIIPQLTQVRVPGNPAATFATIATVVLGAGQDQIQRLAFSAQPTAGTFTLRYIDEDTAPLPFNATPAQIQAALNALTKLGGVVVTSSGALTFDVLFTGVNGKIPHPNLLVSANTLAAGANTVSLAWLLNPQAGVPQGQVDAQALSTGQVAAPLYTLTEIVNPVTGLTSILNITDAVVGRDIETDNAARVRSQTAQASPGRSSPDAIAARMKQVTGVTEAIVFQNEGDGTDANGLPPHSIRVYVAGGEDQDVLNALWLAKAGGIKTDGTTQGTVTDSAGLPQPVAFSRPDVVGIYINITVTTDPTFPANGAQAVADALTAYVNDLDIGADVIVFPRMIAAINSISGITDVSIAVGTAPNPTGNANVVIGVQQMARVVVESTDVVVTVQ